MGASLAGVYHFRYGTLRESVQCVVGLRDPQPASLSRAHNIASRIVNDAVRSGSDPPPRQSASRIVDHCAHDSISALYMKPVR